MQSTMDMKDVQLKFKSDDNSGVSLIKSPEATKELEIAQQYGLTLSNQDISIVDAYSKQIDISNSGHVINYGTDSQKKMAEFSDNMLSSVKTKDTGEISDQITGLVAQLNSIDNTEQKGFFNKLFKRTNNSIAQIKAGYTTALDNVENISRNLQNHQAQLYQDIASLDQLYKINLDYFKEITMYIIAGKKALDDANNKALDLQLKAQQSGLPQDAQAYNDYTNMINRFERKLHDLELTRNQSLQMGPQIRLIQNNNSMLIEKIQTVVVNTIPLWKNQMVISLGLENSRKALASQRAVTDATNEMMRRNAEMLHTSTIETAKEMERGIIDLETLKQTNQQLIATLDEVQQIQSDGRMKRMEAERELQQFEGDLKGRLLQIKNV